MDTWRATSSLQQKAVRTVWPPSNSHNTQVLSLHPPLNLGVVGWGWLASVPAKGSKGVEEVVVGKVAVNGAYLDLFALLPQALLELGPRKTRLPLQS